MSTSFNPLQDKLRNGEPVIGTILSAPSPQMAQMFAAGGFDWLLIDREHGAIGAEAMHNVINTLKGYDTTPVVRVPKDQFWMAQGALDLGGLGIFFPLVKTPGQARAAVDATRFPPDGNRGFGPIYCGSRLGVTAVDYAETANDSITRVVMIEHMDAIRNVDEIMAVAGFEAAFIAPFDLSQSLGIPGQFDHPDFLEAVATAEKAILASGKAMGGLALTPEQGRQMIGRGYTLMLMSYDAKLIEDLTRDIVTQVKA